tara:strand:- start:10917 stop:12863 length:1947 start_codon:yes stop_codon:yes gene_type:complete
MAYMTGLIGSIQQLETANATPDPAIWAKSLSGLGNSQTDQNYNGGDLSTYMGGIVVKDDGSTMVVGSMGGTLDDFIIQYDMGTAFTIDSNVTVSSSSGDNLDINPPEGLVGGVSVADDGSKVYSFGRSTNNVNRFDLSTAWDLSTGGSAVSNFNTSSQIALVYDGFVKNDGTEMYAVGYNPDNVYQYTLSTAHNLSTASLTNTFDISSKVTACGGIHFESNGYAFVVADIVSDKLHKYNLSTAWDVSTATFDSSSDSLNTQASTLSGVWFDDDWTYIFYTDQDDDDIMRINVAGTLGAPNNLAITAASTTQLNLSWDAVSGASSYDVHRSTSSGSGFSEIATPSSNSYNDTGRSAGTRYYYKVRAVDSNGDGAFTSEANSFTLPNQVTGLSASVISSSQINLSWNNPTGTEAGYKIERSTSSGSGFSQIASQTGTTYSATGLTGSTTYYFRVRAFTDPGGDGAYSSEASGTTQAGSSAPTSVRISTASSGGYANAVLLQNQESSAQWLDEDGSNFSGNSLVIGVPVSFSSSDAYEYAVHPNGTSGYSLVYVYAYGEATGGTSYAWSVDNFQEDSSGISSISNVVESTAQDGTATALAPAASFRVNGVSGGRGYLAWQSEEQLSFDINFTATNSTGSTSAQELDVKLQG